MVGEQLQGHDSQDALQAVHGVWHLKCRFSQLTEHGISTLVADDDWLSLARVDLVKGVEGFLQKELVKSVNNFP